MVRLVTLLTMMATANAFTFSPHVASTRTTMMPTTTSSPTSLFGLLTEEETTEIMQKAMDCSEGECSIEDVENLLGDLKEQQKVLTARLEEVTQMISSLGAVNKEEERKVDEVRETVRAIARLFLMGDKASGNDYPALSKPTGWSGEVGKGSTTAYDALPPKKWKATN